MKTATAILQQSDAPEILEPKQKRGFAAMSPEKQREIARQGGRAAQAAGTAHRWTHDEAQKAGSKGGKISRGGRGRITEEEIIRRERRRREDHYREPGV